MPVLDVVEFGLFVTGPPVQVVQSKPSLEGLTDAVLLKKARDIGAGVQDLPTNFDYSHTWLLRWKKRHSISTRRANGSGLNAADKELAELQVCYLVHPSSSTPIICK